MTLVRNTLTGILSMVLCSGTGSGASADINLPKYPRGQGEACVEPSEVMRRDHYEYLMHHRQVSVHLGVRTKRHSLVGCVDCHAARADNGNYLPVNAPGQFCQSCHEYTAGKMDCFSCHSAVPDALVRQ